jgi:hypothetical protein
MRHFLIALAGFASVAAAPESATVDDLAWISGRWESLAGDRWVEESWSEPRGGTIFAVSRTGRGDVLREFEFLRLQRGEDGRLAYVASPNGRPPVAFPLVELGATSATFANPSHDFPQRIRYERDGDTLRATISASDGSNATSWTFRRMP